MWKKIFQRIDCIRKGPDANNINSIIAVESAETMWASQICKYTPSMLGTNCCCNNNKAKSLILEVDEDKYLAAAFDIFNMLLKGLIFIVCLHMFNQNSPISLLVSCLNVRHLNQEYIWHFEALHVRFQGKLDYRKKYALHGLLQCVNMSLHAVFSFLINLLCDCITFVFYLSCSDIFII